MSAYPASLRPEKQRNPQVMGHLVVVIFTTCARLLDGLAALLEAVTGGHA